MIFYKPEYIHVNMNNKVITLNTVNSTLTGLR